MARSTTNRVGGFWLLGALCVAIGCRDASERAGTPASGAADAGLRPVATADRESVIPTPERRRRVPQPGLSPPRRSAPVSLEEVWLVGGPSDPGRLVQPVHLLASALGVLVADLDGAHVRAFDSRTGKQIDTIGRYGLGPGEFGRVPQLLGSYRLPLAFEGANGRISTLKKNADPITSRVATGHSWSAACQVGEREVLLTYVGWDDDGYFVSTIGPDAALVDSFVHPIESLREVLPIGRQAPVYQVDDSTCAILPTYAQEFAIHRGGRILVGVGVEASPIPLTEGGGGGVGASRRVAAGVRPTNRSATSWRGRLILLHAGRTALRRRLLDIYDAGLRYESSLVLPFEAQFVATSGDTLFALGEEGDEPVLAAFLIRSR